jgi:hypothetical protein
MQEAYIISDIDGVLCDFLSAFRERLVKRFGWAPTVSKFTTYELEVPIMREYKISREEALSVSLGLIKEIEACPYTSIFYHTVKAYNKFIYNQTMHIAHRRFPWHVKFVSARKDTPVNSNAIHAILKRHLSLCVSDSDLNCILNYNLEQKLGMAIRFAKHAPKHPFLLIDDHPSIVRQFMDCRETMPRNLQLVVPIRSYNRYTFYANLDLMRDGSVFFTKKLSYEQLSQLFAILRRRIAAEHLKPFCQLFVAKDC